jgi:hypothetical protein
MQDFFLHLWSDYCQVFGVYQKGQIWKKKSRIRETSNHSTDADSSTDATVGWTKNTQKPKKKFKTEKIIQNGKTQKRLEICQN